MIKAGEEAIELGIDYYYLRMRVGIAAYELEDYSKAISHFKKALEFNSADDTAKEYLYFAYKFLGREMEADNTAKEFSEILMQKLSYTARSGKRSFSLNGAGSFLQDQNIISGYSYDADPGYEGFQTITRSFTVLEAGIEHHAGKRTSATHALTYLSKNYMLYTREGGVIYRDDVRKLSQMQYYVSGRILLGDDLYLIPAIHYVNVRIPYYTTIAGRGGMSVFVTQYRYQNEFAGALGLERYFGKIKPAIQAGYSNINEQSNLQGTFSLTFFPSGNLNLYSYTDATFYSSVSDTRNNGEWIFTQQLSFRTFPRLWVELWGRVGEMKNFAGSGASVIYNDAVITREQYGVSLIIPFVWDGMELAVHYSYSSQESRFSTGSLSADIIINPVVINNHKIGGGIKWNF